MAMDAANGNAEQILKESPELSKLGVLFQNYMKSNEFNCVFVEKATKGNSLFFNMMYMVYKLDWKSVVPKFTDNQFKNLAIHLQ